MHVPDVWGLSGIDSADEQLNGDVASLVFPDRFGCWGFLDLWRTGTGTAAGAAQSNDGQAIPLLDDRGWSSSGPANTWAYETVEGIESTARTVVGPDEPMQGQTHDEADADYWGALADTVRRYGVEIDPAELAALPHDVELSSSLLAQLRHGEAGST